MKNDDEVTLERPWGPTQVSTDGFASSAMNNTRTYGPVVDRINSPEVTLEATALVKGTNYMVRVLALSPYLNSFLTNPAISNVVPARPSQQPTSVTSLVASAVTENSIVFTWSPPAGFEVTEYMVSWTPNPNSTVLAGNATSFNLSSLVLGTVYSIRVQARNLNYKGYEAGVTATGSPQGLPSAPRSLRLTAVLNNGVDLRWDAPDGGPTPTAFVLQCRSEQDPASDSPMRLNSVNCLSGPASSGASFIAVNAPLAVDARTARVQGLYTGREYQFRVCTVGLSIKGITCGGYVTATPSSTISPVQARMESVTEDSVS